MNNNFRLVKFRGLCKYGTYWKHWGNCTYWPWVRQLKKDKNQLKEIEQ